jgi:hypothetical protein
MGTIHFAQRVLSLGPACWWWAKDREHMVPSLYASFNSSVFALGVLCKSAKIVF